MRCKTKYTLKYWKLTLCTPISCWSGSVDTSRWNVHSFLLCYPVAPHQRPQSPAPLCSLLTGLCYRRVADENAQVGCENMADVCMSFCIVLLLQKAHLKKKGGRLLNSERECVQGIFASTYGSLIEGGKKGSRYFFKSLLQAPSSFPHSPLPL